MHALIAEDDDRMSELIARKLVALGHTCFRTATGAETALAGANDTFDVIVLDRMLPAPDGVEILQRWRADGIKVPVLMLTAMGDIGHRVSGLEAGADDYLVKPFALDELVARLSALVRRLPMAEPDMTLSACGVTVDLLERRVWRDDRKVHLQPREYALLVQLLRHAGKVVTRTMFLESVWGLHFDPQTNIVESHLSRLRTKLKEGFDTDPIQTVRGVGYRMDCVD